MYDADHLVSFNRKRPRGQDGPNKIDDDCETPGFLEYGLWIQESGTSELAARFGIESGSVCNSSEALQEAEASQARPAFLLQD